VSARKLIRNLQLGYESKIYATVYRIGMFVLAHSLFESAHLVLDKFGYNKFEIKNMQKKNKLSGNLILDLADGMIFLLDKGYQIITTRSLDCIFHTEDEYSQLYDTIQDLRIKKHALCNPEALGFSEAWYIKTLRETIEKLKCVIKVASISNNPEIKVFKHHLYELEMINVDRVLKMTTQSYRETPFSLLFFAQPGVGKTSLIKMAFRHFGIVHDLPTDDSYMYTRNPAANFADGFTSDKWCWVQDDIAFMKPDKLPNGDPTTAESIQLRNTVQFTPDQASIEDKGKMPFRGKLMLGSTNVEHLNAFHFFSCPSALQRRYPYVVDVKVKEEYCITDTRMLDAAKADAADDEYPNYWVLTVSKVKIPERLYELAEKEVILVTSDINEFLSWMSKESLNHFKNEKKMTNAFKSLHNVEICKVCYAQKKFCNCRSLEEQSGMSSYYDKCKRFCSDIVVWLIYYCLIFTSTFTTLIFYLYLRQLTNDLLLYTGNVLIYNALNKEFYKGCARKIKYTIGYQKFFCVLLGTITSFYALFKMASYVNFKPLKEQKSDEVPPEPLGVERHNPWVVSDFRLANLDLSPPILSSKNQTNDEFEDMIGNNIFIAGIKSEKCKGVRYTNILCIKSNIYLVNAHWFSHLDPSVTRVEISLRSRNSDGVSDLISIMINLTDVLKVLNCDLAVLQLPNVVPKRDITGYFPSCKAQLYFNGILLTRKLDGTLHKNKTYNVSIKRSKDNISQALFDHLITFGKSEIPTEGGECGSPLIAHTPKGHMIISLHRAGNSTRDIMGTCVFKEQIDELLKNYSYPSASDAFPLLSEDHTKLLNLHSKSVFNYIENGTADVYGSLSGFKTKHKSRVCNSLMKPFLTKRGYEVKYTKPDLGGWKPWRLAALDLVNPIVSFDKVLVDACAEGFLNHIKSQIPQTDVSYIVHKYDQFTSINGAQGITYVDKINRNTSAGYPFYKQKRHFLIDLPPQHGLDEPVGVNDVLQERIDFIEERYRLGLRYKPIFVASLKDEPITFEKAEIGKVRVFGSAPVDWIIVVRKYLLSFVRLMQNRKFEFECAIGTVAQSGEWTSLYNYICKHGKDRIVAGDFKKFDKKMSPVFIEQAFSIIRRICKYSGNYDAEDLSAITAMGTDTAFPLMDFNGDLVQFFGSNPSGHSLTVIINSIVNSLYMRYVFVCLWYKNCGTNLSIDQVLLEFTDKVSLLSYGDDNIMGVHKDIPWFNHTSISEEFSIMGIDYTMADKESESVPYIHISDASFLKRRWVFDKDLGYHLAPLDHDSIEKMLLTWTASDTLSPPLQCLSVVSSAIREYFFYGKDVYNAKRDLFIELFEHLEMKDIPKSTLPFYEELVEQYIENTSRVLNITIIR